jgi:hypothetical protein
MRLGIMTVAFVIVVVGVTPCGAARVDGESF